MSALYTPQRESKGWSFDHFFSASGFADLLRSQLAQGEKKQALDYLFSSFPMAAKRKSVKGEMGECVSDGGRPEKVKIVEEWQRQHPEGKKIDCERETGLSRHTVLKWWK